MTTSCKPLLVLSLCFTLLATASAQTFSLTSSADAFMTTGPTGNLVNSNYGGTGGLALSAPLAKGEFQSALRFDFAGAKSAFDTLYGPGQWTVQGISLQLVTSAGGNAIFNTAAAGQFGISWVQNDVWTEGSGSPMAPGATGINFSTLTNSVIGGGDQSAGTFAFGGGTVGTNSYSLTLASGLVADVLAGDLGSLRLFAADSTVSYLFNSKDFGTVTSRPVLTITAVPEPASIALGALAAVFFLGRNIFRRQRD